MNYHTELRPAGFNLPDRAFVVSDIAVPCRCCGGPTDVVWQASQLPGMQGYWLVTCKAKPGACQLAGHTRSSHEYGTFDLSKYDGATEKPGWTMPDLPAPKEVQA